MPDLRAAALGGCGTTLGPGRVRGAADEHRLALARLTDAVAIARLYRSQPPEERALYHPFPFDRFRLLILLGALLVAQHLRGPLLRRVPRASVMVWVARAPDGQGLAAFGSARFRRDAQGRLLVRTGLLVAPSWRRAGIGAALKGRLLEEARRMGARRAEALMLPSNTAVLALNERLGYRIRPVTFRDRRSDARVFRLGELDLDGWTARPAGALPLGTPAPARAMVAQAPPTRVGGAAGGTASVLGSSASRPSGTSTASPSSGQATL